MLEFHLKKLTVKFDFSFFAAVTLLMLLSGNNYAVIGLAVCLWHELGHFAVMLICGVKVRELIFYGAGIKIIPDRQIEFTGFGAAASVYLAGSAANFLAAALLSALGNPEAKLLAAANTAVGAFNLLPLGYLDGGKIILLIIRELCGYQRACLLERCFKRLNVFLILVILIVFTFIKRGNFTLYLTLCFLLISEISCG